MTAHVLVLCTHNSARSVLAEGMLNHWAARLGCDLRAHSAGSAPSGRINPLALEVLHGAGVATAGCRSKSWDEFSGNDAPPLSLVITVCGNAANETCPVWPGHPPTAHWGIPDPAHVEPLGARRAAFEAAYQALKGRVEAFLALPLESMSRDEALAAARRIHDREVN